MMAEIIWQELNTDYCPNQIFDRNFSKCNILHGQGWSAYKYSGMISMSFVSGS